MKKSVIVLMLVSASIFYSCSPKLALNGAPVKDLAQDQMVQNGYLKKKNTFNFSTLQSKAERKRYLKKINQLSGESLRLFKAGKMPADNYIEFSEFSEGAGSLLWIAGTSGQTGTLAAGRISANQAVQQMKEKRDKLSSKIKKYSTAQENSKITSEEDPFIIIAAIAILLMDSYLEQYRQ